MIQLGPNRKNKIDLNDYNYQRDIKNRLLMATFSVFDVEILEEVLNNSLKIKIDELAEDLDSSSELIMPTLKKLEQAELIEIKGSVIQVDKEMRKYYEFQVEKFDESFRPGMDFFQGLLSKVPIHVLPSWYAIPRTSNNIFQSIIDKYLLTPKIFQRYLLELNFDNDVLNGIMEDVFCSPDFVVRSRELREKYDLSREEFEEYMLHLEFNFVLCLSYRRFDDQWKEVVTPFEEWEEHLRFIRNNQPEELPEDSVTCERLFDFVYVRDVENVLRTLFPSGETSSSVKLTSSFFQKVAQKCRSFPKDPSYAESYFSDMLNLLDALSLIVKTDDCIEVGKHTVAWLEQNFEKKALFFYNNPRSLIYFMESHPGYTERQLREVEKNLAIVKKQKWVDFDSFINRLLAPIGDSDPVTLKKVGRKWSYVRPEYTEQDKRFVMSVIDKWLVLPGMVHAAKDQKGDLCFSLTSFGRSILG